MILTSDLSWLIWLDLLPDLINLSLLFTDRHDHGPEDDHMDNITGLSSCNKMKLLASCSIDGTVKIWNEANVLVRQVLYLNILKISYQFDAQLTIN